MCDVSTHQRKTFTAGDRVGRVGSRALARASVGEENGNNGESGKEGKLNPEAAAELMSAAVKGEEGTKGDERSAAAGGARKEGRKAI